MVTDHHTLFHSAVNTIHTIGLTQAALQQSLLLHPKAYQTTYLQALLHRKQEALADFSKKLHTTPEHAIQIAALIKRYTTDYAAVKTADRDQQPHPVLTAIYYYLEHIPPYPGFIYRGVRFSQPSFAAFVQSVAETKTFALDAISSWSSEEGIAIHYATKFDLAVAPAVPVVFAVFNQTGCSIKQLSPSGLDYQKEVLVPKHTTYLVMAQHQVQWLYYFYLVDLGRQLKP